MYWMNGWKISMLPPVHKRLAINTHEALAEVKKSMIGAMVNASIIAIRIDLKKLTVDFELLMSVKRVS